MNKTILTHRYLCVIPLNIFTREAGHHPGRISYKNTKYQHALQVRTFDPEFESKVSVSLAQLLKANIVKLQ